MSKSRFFSGTALSTFAALSLVAVTATPAFAQETPEEKAKNPPESLQTEPEIESGKKATATAQGASTASPAGGGSSIVVTGSRIKRPNLESPVPVTSVGGEEFFQTGNVSVGDYLNNLPSIRNTFTISNSTRFLGTTGLSLLDLRGLGTTRTLVLVNGRRHVPGDGSSAVDINTIPADLIDRVDVVTGGNSAVYGSDAIAGVVNFVLKQNYDGITVRGQAGTTKYHDLGSRYISVLAGTNFAEGRGNIAANVEVAQEDPAYMGVRGGWWAQGHAFVAEDTDPSGTPNGSDGNPDNVFYDDVRFPFFQNGGGFYEFLNQPFEGGVVGTPYIFDKNGNLIPQTGKIVGRPNNPFAERYIGGNGSNGLEGTSGVVSPQNNRWSLNLLGHFTVSDAFEPFFEAKYVKQKARGGNFGPFFFGFGTATGSPREVMHSENPFLSNQARGIIADYYGLTGDPAIDGDFLFNMTSTVTDFGNRDDQLTRDTYRIVGGVRGRFNDDWNYEISANYGVARQKNRVVGNVNLQRFLLSLDAVRDPATGQIVCRSRIDPSAAETLEGLTGANLALAQSLLAQDVAQCVPGNFFGEGNLSPAAADYILQDTTSRQRFTQFDLTGFVSGDTSQFLNLPGGPIGFSLGAEYRQETLSSSQDPLVAAGLTFYNALGNISGIPAFDVKEVFGELRVPILKDVPFFQELTVSAAGRLSDYKGKTGSQRAYNVSAEWAPVRDIRFRGNLAKAVRAPNLSELYFPLSQNFAFLNDPCSQDFIGAGSSTRAANCAAAGIPSTYNYNRGPTYLYLSGGNPDLEAETSYSYTLGGVVQPRFIPGLSISADYYNIKVKNVITAPAAQDIFDACYDLASLNNPFCAAFQRAPGGPINPVTGIGPATGPKGEPAYSLLLGSLQAVGLNYAKLQVRGIDFEVAYRRQLGTLGRVDTRLTYTHVFQNDQFLTPTEPNRADQNLLELGDPKDAFNWDVNLTRGQIELGYKMRYIGRMLTTSYEDWFSKQGRAPENADINNIQWYPATFYHDVRVGFNPTKKFNFYLGIDNIMNTHAPLDVRGTGGGSGIYDTHGRFYYAGAVAKF
jgi:outer membrane receptor protein involved in Fe transport